jgi:alpha-galactosidase
VGNQVKTRKKIVVIGAGSASFGLSTLVGIMRTKALHGMELALVDINVDKVNRIKKLAEILNEKWNANIIISATSNRKEVLPGADYIVISIAIDREECWKSDYEIALKYNISHYAENGGPAGFIHSARNISLILPILEDINKLCPNAFLLNFTNPMQRVCTAINKVSSIKFVGMCHQIYFGYFILGMAFAKELGINIKEDPRFVWKDEFMDYHFKISDKAMKYFDIKAAGINHFTWMLDVREKETGRDIYGVLKKKMNDLPPEFEPLTQELFKIFDYIPVAGDCHIAEYLPYTSDLYSETFKKFDIQMYDFKWSFRSRDKMWKDIEMMISGEREVDHLKNARSERAEIIIKHIEKNSNLYESSVNIPNRGCIKNLPDGAIVDVPGVITGNGIIGLAIGDLPKPIAELCNRQLILNDLTVQAVIDGNIKLVYQLFALDPMINNLDTTVNLADEYIKANIKYLPSFQ